MRIVSGTHRGIGLKTPKDSTIRPTSDKVRGAVFNILRGHGTLAKAHVLDCFCGTGALGLEAISQGAAHCTFIDSSAESLQIARDNADKMKVNECCTFIQSNAVRVRLSNIHMRFSLVFCDPPYKTDLTQQTLAHLHAMEVLGDDAWIVIEDDKHATIHLPDEFQTIDTRTYGDTQIMLARYRRR